MKNIRHRACAYGVPNLWPQAWTLHSTYSPTCTSLPIEPTFLRGPEIHRPPRTPPRSLQDALFFHHLIDFCSLLARFSLPTCLPKTIKIYQKSIPRGNPSWASIFHRFLVGFCSQLRPQKPQKSLKFHWFYRYFCKIGLSKLTSIFDRFWSQLASILDQKINQKSLKNPSPEASKK